MVLGWTRNPSISTIAKRRNAHGVLCSCNEQASDLSDSKLGESICKQREPPWRMTSSGGMSYFVRGIHTQASRTSDPKRKRQLQKEMNLDKLGFEALSQKHDSKIGRPHGELKWRPVSTQPRQVTDWPLRSRPSEHNAGLGRHGICHGPS